MGQIKFRDPKTGLVSFIADDKDGLLIVGKDGKVTGKIDAKEDGVEEEVEVQPDELLGRNNKAPLKIIIVQK